MRRATAAAHYSEQQQPPGYGAPPQQQHHYAPMQEYRSSSTAAAAYVPQIRAKDDDGTALVHIHREMVMDGTGRVHATGKLMIPALDQQQIAKIQRELEVTGVCDDGGGGEGQYDVQLRLEEESLTGADSETIRVCSPTGERCFFNPGTLCYSRKDPLNQNEEFLHPYRKYRPDKTKTWFELNILGSALNAGKWQILSIFIIDVLLSLLIIFEIIPPTIFPVDNSAINTIFTVFTFLLGVFYGISLSRNRAIFEQYLINIMGNIQDTSLNLQGMVDDRKATTRLDRILYNPHDMTERAKRSTVWCMLLDVNNVLRALPFAIKHIYRPGEGLRPELLPMKMELRNELQYRMNLGSDGLDALRGMYTERLGDLGNAGVILNPSLGNLLKKADDFGGFIGNIDFLVKSASTPRILYNLMLIALWTYGVWITFDFYGYWAQTVHLAAYYVVILFVLTFLLGIFAAVEKIGNPFEDPEKSNFTFFDLGAVARSSAKNVDAQFLVARANIIARNIARNP